MLGSGKAIGMRAQYGNLLDLLGMAMGMYGQYQEHLVAVHGAEEGMRGHGGAKVLGAVFDEANRLRPTLQKVLLCGGEGCEAASGQTDLGRRHGERSIQTAGRDHGLALLVPYGGGRGLCRANLGEEIVLRDGQVFDTLEDRPSSRPGMPCGVLFRHPAQRGQERLPAMV